MLELLLAEVGAHLAEAVLAVVGLELLPRLSSWVKEGLRGAVERGRLVSVARVRGQARQAETGVGNAGTGPRCGGFASVNSGRC